MGYEYKGPAPQKRRSDTHNQANKQLRASRRRSLLLDKGKENYFRYDMEDLLAKYQVAENQRSGLAATVFAKGSRNSVDDAKEYAKEKLDDGTINKEAYDTIIRMIDGYTKFR